MNKVKNIFNALIGSAGIVLLITFGLSVYFELISVFFCLLFIGKSGLQFLFSFKYILNFFFTPPMLVVALIAIVLLAIYDYFKHYATYGVKGKHI